MFVAAACSTGHRSAADDRLVAIYSAVIRAAVTEPAGEPPSTAGTPVFVLGSHAAIPLEVQAGVVDALHDFATVHFVDEPDEAIDDTDPREAVHDDGVLLTIGDIPNGLDEVTVEAQRYRQRDVTTAYTIRLRRSGSTWEPVRGATVQGPERSLRGAGSTGSFQRSHL